MVNNGKTIDENMEDLLRLTKMSEEERDKYFATLPPDKSSSLLVEHLMQKEPRSERDSILHKAKTFHYDDFKSLHATPKMILYKDLLDAGYHDLAQNVIMGIYD